MFSRELQGVPEENLGTLKRFQKSEGLFREMQKVARGCRRASSSSFYFCGVPYEDFRGVIRSFKRLSSLSEEGGSREI